MKRACSDSFIASAVMAAVVVIVLPTLAFENTLVAAAEPARAIELLFLGDKGHHNPVQRAGVLKQALGPKAIHITYTENLNDLNRKTLGQ